jgi:transposase
MSKYTAQFKARIVRQYLRSRKGYRLLSQEHGVDEPTIRKWVGQYRYHGLAGLKKKFSHYDAPFKLRVLQHMWKNEMSCRETALVFDIRNANCLRDWERRYHGGGIDALKSRPRGRPTNMPEPFVPKPQSTEESDARSREELLDEIESLRAEVAYLKKLEALVQAKKQAQQKKRK